MHERTAKCMFHKGFCRYSNILARSNYRIGEQENAQQFFTAHTLDRYPKSNPAWNGVSES